MLGTTFGGMNTIFSAMFFGVHQGANWALDPIRHDFFLGSIPLAAKMSSKGHLNHSTWMEIDTLRCHLTWRFS